MSFTWPRIHVSSKRKVSSSGIQTKKKNNVLFMDNTLGEYKTSVAPYLDHK